MATFLFVPIRERFFVATCDHVSDSRKDGRESCPLDLVQEAVTGADVLDSSIRVEPSVVDSSIRVRVRFTNILSVGANV